jgi:hypothetical protein
LIDQLNKPAPYAKTDSDDEVMGYFDVRLRPVRIKSPVQEVLCDQRKPAVGTGA